MKGKIFILSGTRLSSISLKNNVTNLFMVYVFYQQLWDTATVINLSALLLMLIINFSEFFWIPENDIKLNLIKIEVAE